MSLENGAMILANQAFQEHKLEAAKCFYWGAISLSEKRCNPLAHYFLGNILFIEGKFDVAIQRYNEAIAQKGVQPYPEAYYGLGEARLRQGDADRVTTHYYDAIQSFQVAIDQKGGPYPEAHCGLGKALFKTGSFQDSKTVLESMKYYIPKHMATSVLYSLKRCEDQIAASVANTGDASEMAASAKRAREEAEEDAEALSSKHTKLDALLSVANVAEAIHDRAEEEPVAVGVGAQYHTMEWGF